MRSNSTTRRPSVQHTCLQCGQSRKVFASAADQGRGKFCNRLCQVSYHATQAAQVRLTRPISSDIPLGYCYCGCNQQTNIASKTHTKFGWIKGQPMQFISGHNTRLQKITPVAERFWSKIDKNGPIPDYRPDLDHCWIWTGSVDSSGYGYLIVKHHRISTHRLSYELNRRPIPEGLVIDHLCRVTRCVNPDHLEAVSHQVNILRGIAPSAQNARKTHCPYCGNPYDYCQERDSRTCKSCKNERLRSRRRERSHL